MPSSYWNEKIGGVRYIASACVDIKVRHSIVPPLTFTCELFVLAERTLPQACIQLEKPITSSSIRKVSSILKGNGQVNLEATAFVHNSKPVWVAGTCGLIGITVKNESPLRMQKLVVELFRRFKTYKFSDSRDRTVQPLGFSRVRVYKKYFLANSTTGVAEGGWWQERKALLSKRSHVVKEKQYWNGIDPHSSAQLIVDLEVPRNAYSVRNAVLIDVSYALKVSIVPEIGCVLLLH